LNQEAISRQIAEDQETVESYQRAMNNETLNTDDDADEKVLYPMMRLGNRAKQFR
jgi:hypothetical protein